MGLFSNIFRSGKFKDQPIDENKVKESDSPNESIFEIYKDVHQPVTDSIEEAKGNDTVTEESMPIYDPTLDLIGYNKPPIDLFSNETQIILEKFKNKGEDENLPIIWSIKNRELLLKDLSELKTVFVCGGSETGKTTFLSQLIISLLLIKHPSQLKFLIVGIKPLELRVFRFIEKHFLVKLPGEEEAIIQDPIRLQNALKSLCLELDSRYDLLKEAFARNITDYNRKFIDRTLNPQKGHQFLPFIVIIIDDLPGFALQGKESIQHELERIITDGYKVGIYACLTNNTISAYGLSNSILHLIEQRVVFNLFDKDEYKKFFNTSRLEKYLNKGEFLYNEGSMVQKGLAMYFDFSEIEKLVDHISSQIGYPEAFLLPEYINEDEMNPLDFDRSDRDPLFEDAARLIVQNQIGSTSLLQRRMKLGYHRASRLMDQLEAAGIVGPNQGSHARDVLLKTELELQQHLDAFRY